MKRIQLFEFEDFGWLPWQIRTGVTNLIVVLHRLLGTHEVIAGLINKAGSKVYFSNIVDLGSGSGGAMPEVIQQVNKERTESPVDLILSDLHPNPAFIKEIEHMELEHVTYKKEPVNATHFGDAPDGLKTMVNSFHHMPPDIAKKILHSAQNNRQPLLIYEMSENYVPTLLWWLLLPFSLGILILMVLFMTPFVRPLSWQQLLFTYLIPIIPIIYAWDGQASNMRTYTFGDLEQMIGSEGRDGYHWEMGKAKKSNGKNLGYYVLGYPK